MFHIFTCPSKFLICHCVSFRMIVPFPNVDSLYFPTRFKSAAYCPHFPDSLYITFPPKFFQLCLSSLVLLLPVVFTVLLCFAQRSPQQIRRVQRHASNSSHFPLSTEMDRRRRRNEEVESRHTHRRARSP